MTVGLAFLFEVALYILLLNDDYFSVQVLVEQEENSVSVTSSSKVRYHTDSRAGAACPPLRVMFALSVRLNVI